MHIPLIRARDGRQVATALVDESDYLVLSQFTWRLHTTGYACRSVDDVTVYLHQEVMGTPPEGKEVDHVSRNRLDNRRVNLRFVSSAENSQNRSVHRNNTSGSRGVHWVPRVQKWSARVRSGGRLMWSAYFPTLEAANTAVMEARQRLFPFSFEG